MRSEVTLYFGRSSNDLRTDMKLPVGKIKILLYFILKLST